MTQATATRATQLLSQQCDNSQQKAKVSERSYLLHLTVLGYRMCLAEIEIDDWNQWRILHECNACSACLVKTVHILYVHIITFLYIHQ